MTANEALQDACDSGIACLDSHSLLVVIAQSANSSSSTAAQILAAACASGVACADHGSALVIAAQSLNT